MVTKKKQRKNEDFKKVKLKVGKKLKKTNATDHTVTAKQLVLGAQLEEKEEKTDVPLSYRGLALEDLCKQLGHFNKNIRRDAIVGIKQLLSSRQDLIAAQLRTLVPCIGRLVTETGKDAAMDAQLRALLQVICSARADAMAAHFTLLVAHVLRAITHMELAVRSFALTILSLLMTSYPSLSRNNSDLFHSFVKFLGSSRKPAWNTPRFLDTISAFMKVFERRQLNMDELCQKSSLSFENETCEPSISLMAAFPKGAPFDVAVLSTSATATVSPFEMPESLIALSEVLAPIITISMLDDTTGVFLPSTLHIVSAMGRAVANQPNAFLVENFEQSLTQIWAAVLKVAKNRKSPKVREAFRWLEFEHRIST